MSRRVVWGGIALLGLALIAGIWLSGSFAVLADYAQTRQRDFQNTIALTLRALRAGDIAALGALLTACFAYGFFHAIGPGHGKIIVGGYGAARDVPMVRLSVIALLASLGQAVTAILLVYGALWLFALTREATVGIAENTMAPLSYGAIALVGLWLAVRGLRGLYRGARTAGHAPVGSGDHCAECGHKHGPSIDDARAASTPREALAVIAGIAVRPCTGALFVLIITWQMGIPAAGIAGAFAMAIGTALVTVAVGLAASGMRSGVMGAIAEHGMLRWAIPAVELCVGGIVVALAAGLLAQTL